MEEEKETKKVVPPYLPYKTFTTFIESLKTALPPRIDRSLMKSMSGGMQQQLVSALEYLDLTSKKTGTATERLQRLVHSDGAERQKVLKEILVSSYPFLFEGDFDLSCATQKHFSETFEKTQATGSTLRKGMAFFARAAKDAGIALSPYLEGKRGPRVGSTRQKRKNSVATDIVQTPNSTTQPDPKRDITAQEDTSLEKLLLSKFPAFDPAWSPEVQAKWFDGFDKLTERFKKK